MSHENAALIQSLYAAFAAQDLPSILGRFTPETVWNEAENHIYADGNPYIGPEAIAIGVFARLGSEWNGFAVSVEEILAAEDLVVVLGRYRGTYKVTGKPLNAQMVHAWRVVDGKVASFQQYADTLQLARVMGGI
jgi:uncharacterized protein